MIENFTTNQPEAAKKSGKSRRGFASMDKDRHKLVSSKGGKAVRSTYSDRNLSATPETNASPLN
jgi:general stress protein YciG